MVARSYTASRIEKARILSLFGKNGSGYAHLGTLLRELDFGVVQLKALVQREQSSATPLAMCIRRNIKPGFNAPVDGAVCCGRHMLVSSALACNKWLPQTFILQAAENSLTAQTITS
jgi:hypothetical protein